MEASIYVTNNFTSNSSLLSWVKVLSKQRQLYYWFNPKTGQTQWEENVPLNDSEYIDHFMTWICGVVMTLYPIKPDQKMITCGDLFPRLRTSMTDIFPQIKVSEHVIPSSIQPTSNSLFQAIRSWTDLEHYKNIDHMYIPCSIHEYFETEYSTRAFFKWMYTSINSGGIVWGLTIDPEFIQTIKTGCDPYKRLWKNSHAKHKSLQKQHWTNDTHSISLGPANDFILCYGKEDSHKTRGWVLSNKKFKQYCEDYKFEVLVHSSIVDFYYKHANDFMNEFKQLVGYKLSYDTDWKSMFMYNLFILERKQ
jgi:hypothetical protein